MAVTSVRRVVTFVVNVLVPLRDVQSIASSRASGVDACSVKSHVVPAARMKSVCCVPPLAP